MFDECLGCFKKLTTIPNPWLRLQIHNELKKTEKISDLYIVITWRIVIWLTNIYPIPPNKLFSLTKISTRKGEIWSCSWWYKYTKHNGIITSFCLVVTRARGKMYPDTKQWNIHHVIASACAASLVCQLWFSEAIYRIETGNLLSWYFVSSSLFYILPLYKKGPHLFENERRML